MHTHIADGVRRRRILLPLLSRASFVETDMRLLAERYDVRAKYCRSPLDVLGTCVAVLSADCVFCWFASIWFVPVVAIARLLRIPVVVVCGGYDVANLPEIKYGNMRPSAARILTRFVLRSASIILPFSRSAERETRENGGVGADKVRMIYLATDDATPATGASGGDIAKQPVVLTVGNIDASTLTRKGLLTVAAVSRLMPDVQFLMVGAAEPSSLGQLRDAAGPNLTFTGRVDDANLHQLMASAKVVFQPSRHEGFGMAVAEAMLYGAVPVVSRLFSLPEVAGDIGYYGDPDNPASFVQAIRLALASPAEVGAAARAHVLKEFPIQRRRSALFSVLEGLLPGQV